MRSRWRGPRTVRLWWRCRLCRVRFDLFGLGHDTIDDQRIAGQEFLDHLESVHDIWPGSLIESRSYLEAAGATTRVVKRALLAPLDGHAVAS